MSLYFTISCLFFPSKLSLCVAETGPHQIHSSFGPLESTSQPHLDQFCCFFKAHGHDRPTTLFHTIPSVTMGSAGILQNAECGKLSRGNLQKIKCRTFCKLPLIIFPHSAAEKFCISTDYKTIVRSHCTTDVRPMHNSVPRSLPSVFFVVRLPNV